VIGERKKTIIFFLMAVFSLLHVHGTGNASSREFTIGIVCSVKNHLVTVDGFKLGMTELGYVEGKDVGYIYNGLINGDERSLDDEIRRLLSLDIDLLVTIANEPAIEAKKITEGTGTPVLAVACMKVIEAGLVKSLRHPGGNITGVQVAETNAKALEWLVTITPDPGRIYLPYNPDEKVSKMTFMELERSASHLGIELILDEVRTVEEAVAAIEGLPKDVDAVFRIPSQTLSPRNIELSRAAIKRGIPIGASLPQDELILITFASDRFETGRQAARLAHQIRMGVKPSELPMETAEAFLTINLSTAEKIGLNIPDNILMQAKKIIRN